MLTWLERLYKSHLVRFCLVGTLGFIINFILLTILYRKLHWNLFLAQVLAGEIALFNNFLLHHNWTYKSHNVRKTITSLLIQFHLTSWTAVIGTALIVSGGVGLLGLPYGLALVIGALTGLVWNFLWTKSYVWRHHETLGQSH